MIICVFGHYPLMNHLKMNFCYFHDTVPLTQDVDHPNDRSDKYSLPMLSDQTILWEQDVTLSGLDGRSHEGSAAHESKQTLIGSLHHGSPLVTAMCERTLTFSFFSPSLRRT